MRLRPACRRSPSLCLSLVAAGLAPLFALGCEPFSADTTPPQAIAASGTFDAGASASPDAGARSDAGAASDAGRAQDPRSAARAAELARMQAHIASLYAPSDVVHRFTTAGGDLVDCVPFARQPGFSQVASLDGAPPVLDTPRPLAGLPSLAGFGEGSDAEGNLRACPSGAVPIRRLTLDEVARFATLEDFLAKEPLHVLDQLDGLGAAHEHAYYSKSSLPNGGAQATLNVWSPAVEPHDLSISQLWVVAGADRTLQTVEAGTLVDPEHHRDGQARLFIYSTTDNYDLGNRANCYDLECKAFVQLADSHILLGGKFDKTSVPGGEQREAGLRWQFCPVTECRDWAGWWLHYDGGATSEWVGFYPRSRYASPGLRDGADRIDFGGEVAFLPAKGHTTTDMGSGQPASAGFGLAAYQTDLLRITPDHAWASMGPMAQGDDTPSCYATGPLQSAGDPLLPTPPKVTFYFGGTGLGGACQ